jgi:hypothetical protein
MFAPSARTEPPLRAVSRPPAGLPPQRPNRAICEDGIVGRRLILRDMRVTLIKILAGNGDGHVGQRAWRLVDELIFRLERGGQADNQIVPVSVSCALPARNDRAFPALTSRSPFHRLPI